jgi:uracil-DNA glycosylase family 4
MTNAKYLLNLCNEGMEKRKKYFSDSYKIYLKRLKVEYDLITKLNYEDYFLIIWDLMRFARENKIRTGVARGSVAGSLLAFLLEITAIDPIRHDLMFERFMNETRSKSDPADCDLDFQASRRDEVKTYVIDKYGKNSVCSIGAHGRAFSSGAIKDVAKIMKLDYQELNSIIAHKMSDMTLEQAYENIQEFEQWVDGQEEHLECYAIACKLQGLIRHRTIHPSGLIVTNGNVTDYVPTERIQGTTCSQWKDSWVGKRGILKLDILGLNTLDVLDYTYKLIGKELDWLDIPLDDKDVLDTFTKGDTMGIFQFESPHLSKVIRNLHADKFEDLTIATSICRPGSSDLGLIDGIVKRKHGLEEITYPHESVEELLKDTYGYPIFQELVMKLAHIAGNIPLEDTEIMRDAIKHFKHDVMASYEKQFKTGAKSNGATKEQRQNMWDLIQASSGYSFNKCLTGDTMLLTYNGTQMSINECVERGIKPSLYSAIYYDRLNFKPSLLKNRIFDIICNGVREVYLLECYGMRVKATLEHRFLVKPFRKDYWEWLKVSEIHYGDYLLTINGSSKVKGSAMFCGMEKVYDITMENQDYPNFFANGILSHNSHATAYSVISYTTAYLKHYFPLEYMTSCLRHAGDKDKIKLLVKECERMDLPIKLADINSSDLYFSTDGNSILTGLMNIKQVGIKAGTEIIDKRPYRSKEDLIDKVEKRRCNTRIVDNLEKAGVFGIKKTNAEILSEMYGFVASSNDNISKLDITKCQRCSLCKTRTKVVLGEGNKKADVMIIGEAPGYYENKEGRPFVGKAGRLLRDEWLPYIDLKPKDVWISNLVKCFPNVDDKIAKPDDFQISQCIEILKKEIEEVNPKLIVTLGAFPLKALSKNTSITNSHGQLFDLVFSKFRNIKAFPLYHPAYLLYKGSDRTLVEQLYNDLDNLKEIIGEL